MKTIICDSREPESIIAELRRHFENLQVADLGLSSGDLFVQLANGVMIAERKTPEDFVASIADERLFEQSQTIPTLSRFPFVVLDGQFQFRDDCMMVVRPGIGYCPSSWKRSSIEMAKIRAQASGMLYAERPSLMTYSEHIAMLIDWCETKADAGFGYHKSRLTLDPFKDQREQRIISFLSQFPGVGSDRARSLYNRFPKTTALAEMFCYMFNFDPKSKDRPELWGNGTRAALREMLELKDNQTLTIQNVDKEKENDTTEKANQTTDESKGAAVVSAGTVRSASKTVHTNARRTKSVDSI